MSAIQKIEMALLALPVEQSVMLAEPSLHSLPPDGERWSEPEEMAEAERREHAIESGEVQPPPEASFWTATKPLP